MNDRILEPFDKPFDKTLSPPGSKSLTNRALVLAALATGGTTLTNALFADDTDVMLESLARLGVQLSIDRDEKIIRLHGTGGRFSAIGEITLYCGPSGTTLRFLTALATLTHATITLDGTPRMRQRPIGELVDLLRNLGARIEYLEHENFPPIRVHGGGLKGGLARFGLSRSSQFLSAALQVAPYAKHEVEIDLDPNQTSWPYAAMTMQLMDEFDHTCELMRDPLTGQPKRIIVPRGSYKARVLAIEPDASNATYFLAAAAIRPGAKVTIERLGKKSLQGDVGFADVLHRMGASLVFGNDFITITGTDRLDGIRVDLSKMPDTAQTLAVVALFAEGETTIRGLHTLRLKETDRIAALSNELRKLGATVDVDGDDAMTITPPQGLRPAEIDTYDDHRMAMSFAIAGTKSPGITIKQSDCVNKTYPRFFEDLETLGVEG